MNLNFKEEYTIKNLMPTKSDMKNLTAFFYAFSDTTRLRIIILLIIKPLCVGDISAILNCNQTTISHQLKILKSLNLVAADRNGKNIVYYIKNNNIEGVLNATVDCL